MQDVKKEGSYTPARPRYKLPLFGVEYDLEGNFGIIESVENALQENIISITLRCIRMPVSQMAVLLSALIPSLKLEEIKEKLFNEMGISGNEYSLLCIHVHSFLRICIAKPAEREDAIKKVGEYLREAQASHGQNTSDSA